MQTLKVTIAGPAGSGKSGLAAALKDSLQLLGFSVKVEDDKPNPNLRSFSDLGRTPLPEHVRVEIRTVATRAEPTMEAHVVHRAKGRSGAAVFVDYQDRIGDPKARDPEAAARTLEQAREIAAEFGSGVTVAEAPAVRVVNERSVLEAFAAGDLRVQVDEPVLVTQQLAAFVGDDLVKPGTKVRVVHVISKPARGEVRGYVLVEGETTLRLRLPCYSGDWPEMDAEVGRRVLETIIGGGR